MTSESFVTRRLRQASPSAATTYAIAAAFATYFCMYALRKPFSAAAYGGYTFWDWDITLKTAITTSQTLGYALSKYIGIRFCSEVTRARRLAALVSLVLAAEVALLLFAVLPPNWKFIAMFLNGLPLGMIWGLVVLYLEGRQTSELLLAGLSCSFILSPGYVKTVGGSLITHYHVPEFWMPFLTGLIFLPPFLISAYLLDQVPNPNDDDRVTRTERKPMNRQERWQFFTNFAFGLTALLVVYFVLTAYRDFRDNFAAEVFAELGYQGQPSVFAKSETIVAFAVMVPIVLLNLVRDNQRGLLGAYAIMIVGCITLAVSTWLLDQQLIGGLTWMILNGIGAFLAYVPYNSVLFDRLIASTRAVGTAVFAITLADTCGYVGSISVMLTKDTAFHGWSRLAFLRMLSYAMAGLGVTLLAMSAIYFQIRHRRANAADRYSAN